MKDYQDRDGRMGKKGRVPLREWVENGFQQSMLEGRIPFDERFFDVGHNPFENQPSRRLKVKREWTDEEVKDFMSDFHGINLSKINDSSRKVFKDQYDILISQNVGRVNAELMAAGIEWYLDTMVRNLGLNK